MKLKQELVVTSAEMLGLRQAFGNCISSLTQPPLRSLCQCAYDVAFDPVIKQLASMWLKQRFSLLMP